MENCEEVGFEVQQNEEVGRYAVAPCDIEASEIILTETPFAFGPKTDSPPICLGCYSPANCTILCSTCGWPVCGMECESVPAHQNNECLVFSTAKARFQIIPDVSKPCMQYECITPLRVLLSIKRDPKKWEEQVSTMESHTEIRKKQPLWEFYRINVVGYLRGPCKLGAFSEELIHKICGILDVNTFEAPTLNGNHIRCLYTKMAMLSHNCVSNTRHTIDTNGLGDADDYRITLRASVPISKESPLFCSYAYSLWTTLQRREFIKESKYFLCKCLRCQDPTELGTYMSSLKCTVCHGNGIISSVAPLDNNSLWKCSHCEHSMSGEYVKQLFANVMADINEIDFETKHFVEEAERIYRKYSPVLYSRSAYFIMIWVSLIQLYGTSQRYTTDELLKKKDAMCRQILETIDIIEPGLSRLRGITLYELHSTVILLARNLYNGKSIKKEAFKERIQEAIVLLQESYKILQVEPVYTKAGLICRKSKHILQSLHDELNEIEDT